MLKNIVIDMVVGTTKRGVWSQSLKLVDEDVFRLIVVSLSYKGESDVLDVATMGADVLDKLKQKLEGVGQDLNKLKQVLDQEKSEIADEIQLELMVGQLKEEQLLVAGVGAVEAWIKRGDEFGAIFIGGEAVNGVIGKIEVGDRVVLMTSELFKSVGKKTMYEYLGDGYGADKIAVKVRSQIDSSKIAGVIICCDDHPKKIFKKRLKLTNLKALIKLKPKTIKIKQRQKKQNMMVGIVMLILLTLAVGVGAIRKTKLTKELEFRSLTQEVESRLVEAKTIAEVNPERAKDLLIQAQRQIEDYVIDINDEVYMSKRERLKVEVEETKQNVFKQKKIDLKMLVELKVLDITSTEIMSQDKNGSLVLVNKNSLVGVSVKDRSSWEVKFNGEVKDISVYNQKAYLLMSDGVASLALKNKKQQIEIKPSDLWREVSKIDVFGGNVYLLDIGQGEIWKYPRITDGFGGRQRWLGKGIELDLSKVVDMKVDGDIWIITSSGKLERYSRGVPLSFEMSGFPAVEKGKLINPKAIATTETKVYVLEAGAKRVVVFDKETGKFEKQLLNDEFVKGKQMEVVGNKGYVLLDDRVVEFELD